MNINEKMMGLGAKSSVIRELFEYGKKRKAEIGDDKVFDYSIGNPSVPAPAKVNETLVKIKPFTVVCDECDRETEVEVMPTSNFQQ